MSIEKSWIDALIRGKFQEAPVGTDVDRVVGSESESGPNVIKYLPVVLIQPKREGF